MRKNVVILCLFIFFVSCEENSHDYGYGEYYEEFATALSEETFLSDSGETLFCFEKNTSRKFREGDRAVLHYTRLEKKMPDYDYTIRINGYRTVVTSDVLMADEETIEMAPEEPIHLESIWLGSHYLNMRYYIDYHSEIHAIGLVVDSVKMKNDTIRLYFKHDLNDDPPGYPIRMLSSFNLKKALGDPGTGKNISVFLRSGNYGEKEYQFVY